MISVIMSVYNIENLWIFEKSVESILKQSYSDLEFIICDDGSTDCTCEKINEYSKKDSRIKVIRNKKNCGLAFSLNKCLNIAKGEYIARQDADDISDMSRLAEQVAFLKAHGDIAFVGSNVELIDRNGKWGMRILPEYPQRKDFLFTAPFVHGTLMFRTDELRNVGGYAVSKETLRAEDYELEMRLYSLGRRGANIQAYLYKFLEDKNTQARRKYKYRIDEAKIRWKGFSSMGLMPTAFLYVVKPLIVGLIPSPVLMHMKNKHTIYMIRK